MKIKLDKPIGIRDREETELDLDLEGLSADDLINIEEEMLLGGITCQKHVAFSTTYALFIAARAAKMPIDALKAMPMRDASRVAQAVQNFMLARESEESAT